LLVGADARQRIVLNNRFPTDGSVLMEFAQDSGSAMSLVKWRRYDLVIIHPLAEGVSAAELIQSVAVHSSASCVAFMGGKSTAMLKLSRTLAGRHGLRVVFGTAMDGAQIGDEELDGFLRSVAVTA